MATVKWVSHRKGTERPENLVEAGYSLDGTKLYVARGMLNGHMTPGKYSIEEGACRVPWAGLEWIVIEYDLLTCDKPELIVWLPGSGGSIPYGTIAGGWHLNSGEIYYIGRSEHDDGERIPGKVVDSHNGLYVGDKNAEHHYPSYEVLVANQTMPPRA